MIATTLCGTGFQPVKYERPQNSAYPPTPPFSVWYRFPAGDSETMQNTLHHGRTVAPSPQLLGEAAIGDETVADAHPATLRPIRQTPCGVQYGKEGTIPAVRIDLAVRTRRHDGRYGKGWILEMTRCSRVRNVASGMPSFFAASR